MAEIGIVWFAKDGRRAAQENWKHLSIAITLDGKEVKNLGKYYHDVPKPFNLECAGITAESVGLGIYVPPLPVGDHKVTWKVTIESDLNDGWDNYPKGATYQFAGPVPRRA